MVIVRPASPADLSVIHKLQDIPHRENVFVEPLPLLETFLRETEASMSTGKQYYYILEQDSSPLGFIEFRSPEETTSIWGRWLTTLCYACAVLAFDDLNFSKLSWWTRAINKPMLRTCEKLKFRRTGEQNICNITEGFAFIAIGKVILFELTPQEFNVNRHWMKDLALPLDIRFRTGS